MLGSVSTIWFLAIGRNRALEWSKTAGTGAFGSAPSHPCGVIHNKDVLVMSHNSRAVSGTPQHSQELSGCSQMNECLAFCWHEIQMSLSITDQIKTLCYWPGCLSALQIAKEEKLPASHAWENHLPHFWSLPRVPEFIKMHHKLSNSAGRHWGEINNRGWNLGPAVAVHITTAWWHLKEAVKKEGKENPLFWKKIPHFAILGLR